VSNPSLSRWRARLQRFSLERHSAACRRMKRRNYYFLDRRVGRQVGIPTYNNIKIMMSVLHREENDTREIALKLYLYYY